MTITTHTPTTLAPEFDAWWQPTDRPIPGVEVPEGLAARGLPAWALAWLTGPQNAPDVTVIRALEAICEDYLPDFITLTPERCEELGPFEIDTVTLAGMLVDAYKTGVAHAQTMASSGAKV